MMIRLNSHFDSVPRVYLLSFPENGRGIIDYEFSFGKIFQHFYISIKHLTQLQGFDVDPAISHCIYRTGFTPFADKSTPGDENG